MENLQDYQRMPRGQRCPECRSREWCWKEGQRYCDRGHYIQGFSQYDLHEEDADGYMERTSSKEKRVQGQLKGLQGKLLYLEALQLLLRSQVLWLVNNKGYRDELESVVRDLWDLRIRGSSLFIAEDDVSSEKDNDVSLEEENDVSSRDAHDGHVIFSSQSQPEDDRQAGWMQRTRAQRWDPDLGSSWPIPRLCDTIALCYLGLQLLKIPMRQAQLLGWINNGDMPYKTARFGTKSWEFRDFPQEMREQMPKEYAWAFQRPLRVSLTAVKLNRSIINLALSYHLNYAMTLPELRWVPLLVQYAKLLALPVESVIMTKRLARLLHSRFHFPTQSSRSSRIMLLDHPEIRLVVLLIIATKLCFPFSNNHSSIKSYLPRFNWEAWMRGMSRSLQTRGVPEERSSFGPVTPKQVAHPNETLEKYSADLSARWVGDENKVENHPSAGLPASEDRSRSAVPVEENRAHVEAGQSFNQTLELPWEGDEDVLKLFSQTLEPPPELTETSTQYLTYRSVERLSEVAAAFYTAAADAVGIPLKLLVRAVYSQERKLWSWQKAMGDRAGMD
ncbi:hypothetical protein CP533_2543 [Ophiocordyceps camponoti-saundersi (nom. inval.)]|nr:hypothetical protein CP533_2543 [Ophiocordyceps camponoti-saundersi (nom. inval.)]